MDLFDHVMRGDPLTILLLVAGVVVLFLAVRLATFAVRLAMLVGAGLLFAGAAPWSGASDIAGDVAACAAAEARDQLEGWRSFATQRITVTEVSEGASCTDDGRLDGTAEVTLRTVYDVPIGTEQVGS